MQANTSSNLTDFLVCCVTFRSSPPPLSSPSSSSSSWSPPGARMLEWDAVSSPRDVNFLENLDDSFASLSDLNNVVGECFGCRLTLRDFRSFQPGNDLGMEVVRVYIKMIAEECHARRNARAAFFAVNGSGDIAWQDALEDYGHLDTIVVLCFFDLRWSAVIIQTQARSASLFYPHGLPESEKERNLSAHLSRALAAMPKQWSTHRVTSSACGETGLACLALVEELCVRRPSHQPVLFFTPFHALHKEKQEVALRILRRIKHGSSAPHFGTMKEEMSAANELLRLCASPSSTLRKR